MEELLSDVNPSLILAYMAPLNQSELKNYSKGIILEAAKNILRGSDITKNISLDLNDAIYVLTSMDPFDLMEAVQQNNTFIIDYTLNNRQTKWMDLYNSKEIAYMNGDSDLGDKIEEYIERFPEPFYIIKDRWLPFFQENLGTEFFPLNIPPYVTLETFQDCLRIIYQLNPAYKNSIGLWEIPPKYIDEEGQKDLRDIVLKDYKQKKEDKKGDKKGDEDILANVMYSIGKKEPWVNRSTSFFTPWSFNITHSFQLRDLFTDYSEEMSMEEKTLAAAICKRQKTFIDKILK